MTYEPKPINTSNVVVPKELNRLVEAIAENAHENWAAQRISEGWQHGLERNDAKLLHPDLIPYSDLTDTEKEYDRLTAMGTIRLLLALGFKIEK